MANVIYVSDYAAPSPTVQTTQVQAAINAAYGKLLVWDGDFTAGNLSVIDTIRIMGVGAQGDGYRGYAGQDFNPIPSGTKGAILRAIGTKGFHVACDLAFHLEHVQICFAQEGVSGNNTHGVYLSGQSGANHLNTGSSIEHVCITNADYGIGCVQAAHFLIAHNEIRYPHIGGIYADNPLYPWLGNGVFDDNLIWGGGADQQFAISLFGFSGAQVKDNQFFDGGPNAHGLVVSPYTNGTQVFPLVITGNTFEGQQSNIFFYKIAGDGKVGNVVISGNELWSDKSCIHMIAHDEENEEKWINTVSITGGAFTGNGGLDQQPLIQLDGVDNLVYGLIAFSLVDQTVTVPAVSVGSFASNIVSAPISKGLSVT